MSEIDTGNGGETVDAMLQMIAFLCDTGITGSIVPDAPRDDHVRYDDLIGYLSDGGRDIRPSDDAITKGTELFIAEFARHMKRVGRVVSAGKGKGTKTLDVETQARAATMGGLRKMLKECQADMTSNVMLGYTRDGSAARPVSPEYAAARQSRHGVAPDEVYYATGQLANAVAAGKIKINLGKTRKWKTVLRRVRAAQQG